MSPVITPMPTAQKSVTAPAATMIIGCIRFVGEAVFICEEKTSRGASSIPGMIVSLRRLTSAMCHDVDALFNAKLLSALTDDQDTKITFNDRARELLSNSVCVFPKKFNPLLWT
jgi:hypothetical protein